jgi:hypothetical protein
MAGRRATRGAGIVLPKGKVWNRPIRVTARWAMGTVHRCCSAFPPKWVNLWLQVFRPSAMSQPDRTILFHITNAGIRLNPQDRIAWTATNFPPKSGFHFSEHRPHYWRVRQEAYDRANGELTVTVLGYEVAEPEPGFSSQHPKAPVRRIHFRPLDWAELQGQLSAYRKEDFEALLPKAADTEPTFGSSNLTSHDPEVRRIPFEVKVPLQKLRFKLGYAETEKRLPGIPDPVRILLSNPHILPEFEAIKPFFGKLLGKRSVDISGVAEVLGVLVRSVHCSSPDLDRINDQSIASVRRMVLRDSIRAARVPRVDKSLFGSDEIFDDTPAEALGNTYRQQERLLLEEILDAQQIGNRAQLHYLAGQVHEAAAPLKFTLQPHFGFLFYHRGETMHHFLWELLNTNATYLWSLPREPFTLAQAYPLLEREINTIRDQGRMTYIQQVDRNAFVFHRIPHEHRNSSFVDGFPLWRARLMEKLV